MSRLSDALRRARELYLAGAHPLLLAPPVVDQAGLLKAACDGDSELMLTAWTLLDQCAPGGSFSTYADGGRVKVEGDVVAVTYFYDRRVSEVAAVIGKACALAEAMPREPLRRLSVVPPPPAEVVQEPAVLPQRSRRYTGFVQDPEEEGRDGG